MGFITESARSTQENPVEFFQDKGWGKESNKEGVGKGGKNYFFSPHKQLACVVGNESNC